MAEITVIESYSPEDTGKLGRMLGENGNPTYDTLERIARALNVPIQELFANEHNTLICPKCGARFKLEE